MKIVALEEHLLTDEVVRRQGALDPSLRDDVHGYLPEGGDVLRRLHDLSDERLHQMDEAGVDVQVLSLTTPGVQDLWPADALDLARRTNDLIAATVAQRPDRFEGFATLPTPDPAAAARELERAVDGLGLRGAMLFGRTRERNADGEEFLPVYETAAALGVPLYLHPQIPVRAVRQAYYSGFDEVVDPYLAMGGVGWHYETGVQLLRMILAGVFDRFPDLQVVLGHWGEVVLFFLERVAVLSGAATSLQRPVPEYFRTNVSVTPGGILSQRYLRWAIEVLGVDRVLFATDYPYVPLERGAARSFLEGSGLDEGDRDKIAHGNWERLCALRRHGG